MFIVNTAITEKKDAALTKMGQVYQIFCSRLSEHALMCPSLACYGNTWRGMHERRKRGG
jgi:hypothetical protein